MSDEASHRFGVARVPGDALAEEVDVDLDDTADERPASARAPALPAASAPTPLRVATEPPPPPDVRESKKPRARISLRVPDDEVVRRPAPPSARSEEGVTKQRSSPPPREIEHDTAPTPPVMMGPPPRPSQLDGSALAPPGGSAPTSVRPRDAADGLPPMRPRASSQLEPPPLPARARAASVSSEVVRPDGAPKPPQAPRPRASVTNEVASERPGPVAPLPVVPPPAPPPPPAPVPAVAESPVVDLVSRANDVPRAKDAPVPTDVMSATELVDSATPIDGAPIQPTRIVSVAPAPPPPDSSLEAPDDLPTLTDLPAIEPARDSVDNIPIVEEELEPSEPRPRTTDVAPAPPPDEFRAGPPPPVAPPAAPVPSMTVADSDGIDISVDEDAPPEPSSESEVLTDDMLSVETVPPPKTRVGDTPKAAEVKAPVAAAASEPRIALPVTAPLASPVVEPRAALVEPLASPLAPQPMNESAASRAKRLRPWWEELFNDDFIRTMAKITDAQIAREIDFIEDSLGVARGAMILDMACGTGRHSIELTRRGYRVVGLDLSLAMLAKAAEEAQERDQKLNFVQGDMREMTFEDMFDGIFCWNTSFGFFEEEKNAQVIARVHRALRKGGQFVLDVVNRDFAALQAPSLVWFEGDGCMCMDEMQIDWITSRMRVKRTMMMDDGRSREIEYSIRIYSLHELGKMLHDHGFRVAEVSGRVSTPGVFFGAESPRVLVLAEKR
ncbi:MAG: methyltransferase domain-containing protein [Myxococcales bacterium]|nr:methyltransferase domain-containing protein [Myxococcales bacterium]